MHQMNKSRVALVKCSTYNEQEVFSAVTTGIELLGGIGNFIKPREKIVLKPNILLGQHPDKCATTHPVVLKAVARVLQAAGCEVAYGDSPGFGSAASQLQKSQITGAAQELGLQLADFDTPQEVSFPASSFMKKLTLARGALDCDGLVSLCKFKTHQFLRITGAVKNQFGCVPGLLKHEYHMHIPQPVEFAKMLVTLNLYLKMKLYIMDGIMAMEGNGPGNGDPVAMHVLLFSADPVALDTVMCRLIDLNPEYVPTITEGYKMGLGKYLPEELELVGEPLEHLRNHHFKIERTPMLNEKVKSGFIAQRKILTRKPVINRALCTSCGRCIQVCPARPKAVMWPLTASELPQPSAAAQRVPVYNYNDCIRCYCCQELCPSQAITVKRSFVARFVYSLGAWAEKVYTVWSAFWGRSQ
jgi:uncharacterized protein (DUF362 family)/Pyruvate/2-oxoacid:ferredoxin oxidoreductase delta subunit